MERACHSSVVASACTSSVGRLGPLICVFMPGSFGVGSTAATRVISTPAFIWSPRVVTPFWPMPSFRGPVRPNRSSHVNSGQTTRRVERGDTGLNKHHLSSPGQLVRRRRWPRGERTAGDFPSTCCRVRFSGLPATASGERQLLYAHAAWR